MADSIFRNKRRGRAFWLFLPVLLFIYLLLFAKPGGRESLVRPIWARELARGAAAPGNAEGPYWYFRTADGFGYADLRGNLYYLGQRMHNLSLSDAGFINYGSVPDHIVFRSPRGEFEFSIKSYGYPLLESSGQVLYSINTDRSGLKRIDSEGQILWSITFPTLLSTIALAGEQCLLGLMDGRALLLDGQGDILYQHTPDASRIPVVLGAAISEGGTKIALTCGIDPQKLFVVHRRAEGFVPDFVKELGSDFRREVQVRFAPDTRFLFYEVEDGLGILDVRKKSIAGLAAGGVLQSMDSGLEFSAAAFRLAEGSKLVIFRPLDSVLLSREIAADQVYVKVMGSSLILGLNGVLLRADLLEG